MNDNAKLLVAALRSDDYTQTRGVLQRLIIDLELPDRLVGFCCLGVACDVYIKAGNKLRVATHAGVAVYGKQQAIGGLPEEVQEWLGFCGDQGEYGACGDSLSDDNDNGKSFDQIADTIEAEPEGLFA